MVQREFCSARSANPALQNFHTWLNRNKIGGSGKDGKGSHGEAKPAFGFGHAATINAAVAGHPIQILDHLDLPMAVAQEPQRYDRNSQASSHKL